MAERDAADLVVVGAGTVGGWASVFAREAGVERVIVIDRDLVGQGASSRAAGMVRAQGGSPDTVRLGSWSIGFYEGQADTYGADSGFVGRGYVTWREPRPTRSPPTNESGCNARPDSTRAGSTPTRCAG